MWLYVSWYDAGGYWYGFNRKENDNEVKGEGNQQDYGFRIYDPRIAKFLSVDPLTPKYPELTPYQFASNSPILNIDLDGAEALSSMYDMQRTAFDANIAIHGPIEGAKRNELYKKGVALAGLVTLKLYFYYFVASKGGPAVATPLFLSELTGAPVLPSPQVMSGSVASTSMSKGEIVLEETVATGTKTATPKSINVKSTASTNVNRSNSQVTAANGGNPAASQGNTAGQGADVLESFKEDLPNSFKGIDKKHLNAAIGDMNGKPIVNQLTGKVYDYLDDISSHMRSLNGRIRELNKLIDNGKFMGGVLEEAKSLRTNLQKQYDSYQAALTRAANAAETKVDLKKKR